MIINLNSSKTAIKTFSMNKYDCQYWIDNDIYLYKQYKETNLSIEKFISVKRKLIENYVKNIIEVNIINSYQYCE